MKIVKKVLLRGQKNRHCQGGFTLLEMLISVAIFVVITALVMTVISAANLSYHNANARIITQEDLRRALTVMFHELMESNEARVTISGAGADILTFQIPIRPLSGAYVGQMLDNRNNIIFGARMTVTNVPDGEENYAIQYVLQPNNDMSNSNQLIRRVLDSYPNGTQVGSDVVIANAIQSISYVLNSQTLTINVTAVRQNKYRRNETITGNFGITLRN